MKRFLLFVSLVFAWCLNAQPTGVTLTFKTLADMQEHVVTAYQTNVVATVVQEDVGGKFVYHTALPTGIIGTNLGTVYKLSGTGYWVRELENGEAKLEWFNVVTNCALSDTNIQHAFDARMTDQRVTSIVPGKQNGTYNVSRPIRLHKFNADGLTIDMKGATLAWNTNSTEVGGRWIIMHVIPHNTGFNTHPSLFTTNLYGPVYPGLWTLNIKNLTLDGGLRDKNEGATYNQYYQYDQLLGATGLYVYYTGFADPTANQYATNGLINCSWDNISMRRGYNGVHTRAMMINHRIGSIKGEQLQMHSFTAGWYHTGSELAVLPGQSTNQVNRASIFIDSLYAYGGAGGCFDVGGGPATPTGLEVTFQGSLSIGSCVTIQGEESKITGGWSANVGQMFFYDCCRPRVTLTEDGGAYAGNKATMAFQAPLRLSNQALNFSIGTLAIYGHPTYGGLRGVRGSTMLPGSLVYSTNAAFTIGTFICKDVFRPLEFNYAPVKIGYAYLENVAGLGTLPYSADVIEWKGADHNKWLRRFGHDDNAGGWADTNLYEFADAYSDPRLLSGILPVKSKIVMKDLGPLTSKRFVSQVTRTNEVAVIDTALAHNLESGDVVSLTGMTATTYGWTNVTVTVYDADTFTFPQPGLPNDGPAAESTGYSYMSTEYAYVNSPNLNAAITLDADGGLEKYSFPSIDVLHETNSNAGWSMFSAADVSGSVEAFVEKSTFMNAPGGWSSPYTGGATVKVHVTDNYDNRIVAGTTASATNLTAYSPMYKAGSNDWSDLFLPTVGAQNGIKLTGSATDYIYWDIPNASTNLTDFTVWARVYSPYRSSRSRYLKLGARHTDTQDTNCLAIGFNIATAPYGPVTYHTKNGTEFTHRITTDITNVVWGKVFDYCVRRSGSTWTVFCNGVPSNPTTYSSAGAPAANDALYVEYMSLGHGVGYYPSDDVIHAVGLWDRALTTAEVETLTVTGGRLVSKTDAVVFADFAVAPYNHIRTVLDPFYGTGIAGVSALGATSAITNLLAELNYDNTFYPASAAAPTAATGAAVLYSATGTATKLTALDSAGLYGPVNSGIRLQVTNTVACLATNTELLSAAAAAMNPVWPIVGTGGGWTTNGLSYAFNTNVAQTATATYTFTNVVRAGSRFKVSMTLAAPIQIDSTDTTVQILIGNTVIKTLANADATVTSSGVRVDGTTQTIVLRIVDTVTGGTNCVFDITDASVMIQDVGDVVATVPVLANTLGLQGGSWVEFNASGTEAADTPVQFYVQGGTMTTPTAFGTAQTVNGNWRARARVFRGSVAESVRGVIEWQDADGLTTEAAAQVALTGHDWTATSFYLDLTALATTANDVTLYGFTGETKQ